MKEFFRGWRRKAGIVALGLACVFAIAWARSIGTMDLLIRRNDQSRDYIASLDGSLSVTHHSSDYFAPEPVLFVLFGDGYTWQSSPAEEFFEFDENGVRIPDELLQDCVAVQRWDLAGITICSGEMGGDPMNESVVQLQMVNFPYWSITAPLTLLSAYLILWKPRKWSSHN